MPSISFHLKEPAAAKPTAIYIWFNLQNGTPRLRLYTGDKILPAYWQSSTQQAWESADLPDHERQINGAINRRNNLLKERLLRYWAECRAVGKTADVAALRQLVNPKEKPVPQVRTAEITFYPVEEYPYPLDSRVLLYEADSRQVRTGIVSISGELTKFGEAFTPTHWAYAKAKLVA